MSERSKPGPKPERVKIDDDWENAIDRALKKKRPKKGWPAHDRSDSAEVDEEAHSDDDNDEVERG